MHHKNIKLIVKKQLKKQYPNWKRLSRKKKKAISKKVTAEVIKLYDFNKPIQNPIEELLGIEEQVPEPGMMNLEEMAKYIDRFNRSKLIKISSHCRHPTYIQDEELRVIDNLLDDLIINELLSYKGYTPSMREIL
ncbi:MAG: transposase, partial [Desulfobacteraceae bacterium]